MKILLLGDTHGNFKAIEAAVEHAQREEVDTIVQLGDFGWWPHVDWGKEFIERTEELLDDTNKQVCFIDGNHDNHEDLATYKPTTPEGFCEVGAGIFYIPRGARWKWNNSHTFAACGGAYSIDEEYRVEGLSWWREEMIQMKDVRVFLEREDDFPVTILLTHDAPYGLERWEAGEYKEDRQSRANRKSVRAIVEALAPRYVFHGHMHHRYTDYLVHVRGGTVVHGLDMEVAPGAREVLTLAGS